MIELKKDNRYKDGHVVKKNGKLRGNAKTMAITRLILEPLPNLPMGFSDAYRYANPPMVVTPELGDAIRKEFGTK